MKLIGVFSHSYIESMPQSFVIHLYSGTTYKNTPPKQEETLESAKFRGFFCCPSEKVEVPKHLGTYIYQQADPRNHMVK